MNTLLDLKSSWVEKRTAIDQKITELTDQIRDLRSTRNEFAPISSLSQELLLETFFLARDLAGGKWRTKTAFSISRVSRAWRSLALSTPLLWNKIDTESPPHFKGSLERARDLELDLSVYHWSYSASLLNTYVFPLLPRTRSLCLESPIYTGSIAHELILEHLDAPVLRQLLMSNFQINTPQLLRVSPLLHTLRLEGCSLEVVDVDVFPSLTSLTLNEFRTPITVEHLLRFFSSTPNLQRLKVNQILDKEESDDTSHISTHLPHLQTLEIGNDAPNQVMQLLSSLRTSSITDIVVEVQLEGPAGSFSSATLRNLVPSIMSCRQISEWQITRLKVVELPNNTGIQIFSSLGDHELFTYILTNAYYQHIPAASLLELIQPHLLSLQSLDLTNSDVPHSSLKTIFGPLPSLKKVTARSKTAISFLGYLIEEGNAVSSQSSGPNQQKALEVTTFKALVELVLTDMPGYLLRECSSLYQLPAACSTRRDLGVGIGRFTFTRCAIPDGVMAKLRQMVDIVEDIDRKNE